MGMTVIGLTGGIATGKTTAARCLRHFGFKTIDADLLAKHIFMEHFQEIQNLFPHIQAPLAEDFRARLALEVFANAQARHKLNAFMHPAIRTRMEAQRRQLEAENVEVVFYDAPLLFETGGEAAVEASLLVYAPYEMQLQRLMQRNACSREHAISRIASQMDIETKRQRATWVVENLGSQEELHHKLDKWRKEVLSAFLLARQ
jgi:dephospho-CoA kinase